MKLKTTSQRLPADSCQPASSADKLSAKKGFTLIELLLVIAMIAVLASAILVSISGQRDRARVSKVILELSGAIQPLMMCWSDGGSPQAPPNSSHSYAICNISGSPVTSYGTWPVVTVNSGWNYKGDSSLSSSGDWHYQAEVGGINICCDSDNGRCGILASGSTCGSGDTLE